MAEIHEIGLTAAEDTPRRDSELGARIEAITKGVMGWAATKVDRTIGWSRLPLPLGIAVLIGIRDELRAHNLFDTGRSNSAPQLDADSDGASGELARTFDGAYNNPDDPLMGAAGTRFGRNAPPELTLPEPPDRLLEPNPRLISRRLLTRNEFVPATTLNALAAAWIQFEVHDWVVHSTSDSQPWEIALEDDDTWPQRPMQIRRSSPDPRPDPARPPTFINQDSHWWDGSQIYGVTQEFARALRSGTKGQLRLDSQGLPPPDVEKIAATSEQAPNFWVGLALLYSLFMREHNAICERLAAAHPSMSDQDLYDKARLVNSALMAKIHTIDWTPAVIGHPTTVFAMHANWAGLLGPYLGWLPRRQPHSALLWGIPGSRTSLHGVPYALTEEFVAVYRMHPLIPDDFVFRSITDDSVISEHELPDLAIQHVRTRLAETSMDDLLYSFGRTYSGALTLHNFPRHLQTLERPDGSVFDLGAIDVLRVRERGVPRYNEFRRLLRLKPKPSFAALTDNPLWASELAEIYDNDVENVDLVIGLLAESKPAGFGFSDTAFRVFVLMATRRLESDRFFTTDFRPEVYTPEGMNWIKNNSMRSVLLRHFPSLAPALRGVANPFAPWTPVAGPVRR